MHDLSLGAHLGTAKLKKEVMSSFYFPRMTTHIDLLSDNGPQFHSEFWTDFFVLLKTEVKLTTG